MRVTSPTGTGTTERKRGRAGGETPARPVHHPSCSVRFALSFPLFLPFGGRFMLKTGQLFTALALGGSALAAQAPAVPAGAPAEFGRAAGEAQNGPGASHRAHDAHARRDR